MTTNLAKSDATKTTVIESAEYAKTRREVACDNVLIYMYVEPNGYGDDFGAIPLENLVHDGDYTSPKWDFIRMADQAYDKRGGTVKNRHLGAVAETLMAVRALHEDGNSALYNQILGRQD